MDNFETAKRLFAEGLHQLGENNLQAAETQFARSLEILPGRVSTLNNLSAIKIRQEKFAEAEAFARKAIAAEDTSSEAWSNLGIALTAMKCHEDALVAYDRALAANPADAKAWLNKALGLLELKSNDAALLACDQALRLNPGQHDILRAKSLILKELQRPDEAMGNYLKSLEMRVASSPVFPAERRASQKADVLIINQNPFIDEELLSFENLQFQVGNFPRQLAEVFQEDFHFSFVFTSDALEPSGRGRIPQPDLVINNNANGEILLSEGNLPAIIGLVDSFGVPVVNHPSKVVGTTRDASVKLLEGVPGVLVPKTARFSLAGKSPGAVAREIEDQFDYPLITRTLVTQRGIGMNRVESRDDLVGVLASGLPENFFVTEFVDSRGGAEFYRKIRAAVVADEIIIIRVDSNSHWKIHGRRDVKRVPFYLEHPYLLDEEKRVCANPEGTLGRAAMQALRALRGRIPLDVFGVDFDINPDGRLVFYEANATMNLLTTAQKEVPHPKEVNDRLKEEFLRYLTAMATRR